MEKKEMLYMAKLMGMCQRADTKSRNLGLPKHQRDFHAGRAEGYLKALAEFMEVEVAEIRTTVLGTTKARMEIKHPPTDFPLSHWLRNGF
jgi:hypothetical protein